MNSLENLRNLKILELNFSLVKPTSESNYHIDALSALGNKLIYNEESVLE